MTAKRIPHRTLDFGDAVVTVSGDHCKLALTVDSGGTTYMLLLAPGRMAALGQALTSAAVDAAELTGLMHALATTPVGEGE